MYNNRTNPVNNYTIYKMVLTHERFAATELRLGHKMEVLEKDDEFTSFELRIESSLDLLAIFQSGCHYALHKYAFDKIK